MTIRNGITLKTCPESRTTYIDGISCRILTLGKTQEIDIIHSKSCDIKRIDACLRCHIQLEKIISFRQQRRIDSTQYRTLRLFCSSSIRKRDKRIIPCMTTRITSSRCILKSIICQRISALARIYVPFNADIPFVICSIKSQRICNFRMQRISVQTYRCFRITKKH